MDFRRIVNQVVVNVVVATLASAAQADTIYVDDDYCPGPGSGTEADPYCSIQTAIDNAWDFDEIIVAPGTYFETINFLGKPVTVRSVDPTDPDVVTATAIDAAGAGPVVTCQGGEGPDTVLSGLTITNGSALYGSGMYNENSDPTVTSCTFSDNGGWDSIDGGGLYNANSNPTVTDCTFDGNWVFGGGGGMCNANSNPTVTDSTFGGNEAFEDGGGGMYNANSDPIVTSCTFEGNWIFDGRGGGMSNRDHSDPTVTDCTFSGNTAEYSGGGGMYNWSNSSPTVADCTFSGNSVYGRGGGILNWNDSSPMVTDCTLIGNGGDTADGGGMANFSSSPMVTGCTFSGNYAGYLGGGHGGGMYNHQSSPTVIDCRFSENSADIDSGGGMANSSSSPTVTECWFNGNSAGYGGGGGMSNWGTSNPDVTDCTFVGNWAESGGGGMHNWQSNPTVANCTFSGNGADNGGGMRNDASSPTLANCILWGDTPDEISDDSSSPFASYCDVQGGYAGPGNIDVDPLFVDPDGNDVRLSPDSPCIDAGNNSVVPEGITTDLDGNPRFLEIPETPDTGYGDPPIVDMGAYESLGGGCLAITNIETICHGDGSTFSVNIEGLNACTGGTTMATFTGSGGAVGEDLCATLLINTEQGGFCCSTQVCVPVPDCSPLRPPCPCDCAEPPDGVVNVVDFLALLAQWGGPGSCDCGDTLDVVVDVLDFLSMLATWGPCP